MQGSGTFAIESVISSAIPRDGKLLVLVNGAYGRRIAQMARVHGIDTVTLETPENRKFLPDAVAERLAASDGITHVAMIHCETTTGIVNPIEEIGAAVKQAGAVYIVDAMSSFGAIPVDLAAAQIDFLISSANKCIEGVPGFGFVLARRSRLLEAKGRARTLSLDLHAQWAGLESDGQFRFTPPTHALLAFHQALLELEAEGGVAGRAGALSRQSRGADARHDGDGLRDVSGARGSELHHYHLSLSPHTRPSISNDSTNGSANWGSSFIPANSPPSHAFASEPSADWLRPISRRCLRASSA